MFSRTTCKANVHTAAKPCTAEQRVFVQASSDRQTTNTMTHLLQTMGLDNTPLSWIRQAFLPYCLIVKAGAVTGVYGACLPPGRRTASQQALTSELAISAREAASAAHAPLAGPTSGRGDGVVMHALICCHQLVGLVTTHLHMLAHKAACGSAFVVAAWVGVPLHHLLPILAPPVQH